MEQNREPRNKPMLMWPITREANIYNEEKTVSSINGSENTEQLHVKE